VTGGQQNSHLVAPTPEDFKDTLRPSRKAEKGAGDRAQPDALDAGDPEVRLIEG
jgi:hypothetical protein